MQKTPRLEHAAVFYDSDLTVSRQVAVSVIEGITAGEDVLVRLPGSQLSLVSDHLGSCDAGPGSVSLLPAEGAYTRPVAAMKGLSGFVRERAARGVAVRAIGEVPIATDATERDAWLRYEAAVNDVFSRSALTAVCLYDLRRYPTAGLSTVRSTHPVIGVGAAQCSSMEYRNPAAATEGLRSATDPAPRRSPDLVLSGLTRSRSARDAAALLLPERGHDVRLAVGELVNNAIRHGGGSASVEAWAQDGSLVVRVTDGGPGFDDPFAGLRPPPSSGGSAGLWIVNSLASTLLVDRGTGGGARVTIGVDRYPPD